MGNITFVEHDGKQHQVELEVGKYVCCVDGTRRGSSGSCGGTGYLGGGRIEGCLHCSFLVSGNGWWGGLGGMAA